MTWTTDTQCISSLCFYLNIKKYLRSHEKTFWYAEIFALSKWRTLWWDPQSVSLVVSVNETLTCNDLAWTFKITVLLKYGRPVAKCDQWIQGATQGPTMDGPFGDQWIIYVLQKIFRKKSGQTTPQMHWCQIHGLAQDCRISIANVLEILQSCTKP